MENLALRQDATTLVNVLTCAPADQNVLLALLRENMDRVIATLDGWVSSSLVASADGSRVIIVSQWRDADAVKGMQSDERMLAYFPRIKALATFESTVGVVVHARAA
ncbi:antibiotic biosynthesis monooxygenase [Mesorhizobium sp. ES1-4]|uniref:antibiotic biosynthesis monooxygenase n=1 Tax=Mesorhizobium sp. ES1-4 TaxID=2876627 RepID=UPI001CCAE2D0|nr:antibiotic biosynthesis monooxygenase [Mesorhizobium sp. ES1-4]MBZ9796579.1 antibiotic biosynthesis monooxygenase [Mesorhizobium sp. ES1-4]